MEQDLFREQQSDIQVRGLCPLPPPPRLHVGDKELYQPINQATYFDFHLFTNGDIDI